MARSKIIINGETYIDLTADTAVVADVAAGKTFHLANGQIATGTSTKDSDTSDDTALVAEVLAGKTFHARGAELEGTMPNNGAVSGVISDADDEYTVPIGYHDGSGKVVIDATEVAKLKNHNNIKAGVTILGETGSYSGEAVSAQRKVATPTFARQNITPDANYDYLSEVEINPIPITEVVNASGGTTVTVG